MLMKSVKPLRAALVILFAAVMVCLVFSAPEVKAEDTVKEISLLMVYDKSYEDFFSSYTGFDPEDRVGQMVKLANIPYKLKWNIEFDVTVDSYANTIGIAQGPDPSLNCNTMHPTDPDNPNQRNWDYDTICYCSGLNHNADHSRGSTYISAVRSYASSSYDIAGMITCHGICQGITGGHRAVNGLGSVSSSGFIVSGRQEMNPNETNPYQFYNWLYTKYIFMHEISHNFGTHDGYNDATHCTENYPCIMDKGFQNVIYAKDIWCGTCEVDFDRNAFDEVTK